MAGVAALLMPAGQTDTPAPEVASPAPVQSSAGAAIASTADAERAAAPAGPPASFVPVDETAEATVRRFYVALAAGDGETASAQVVAEKRSGRVFSPDAISGFYGALPEPIRLTALVPTSDGAYRVRYRYSAGRKRCDGRAVVRIAYRAGQALIRSIDALDGC